MADNAVIFPAPGEKEQWLLVFGSRTLAGYEWPYFAISGATDGPTLGLIAGVHGAEYPPIEAVMQCCRTLDSATLRGRIVAVPVVNLPAFWGRTPFVCPNDGKNPNRVFPGDPNGTFSEALAFHLCEAVIRRGHYLLATGAPTTRRCPGAATRRTSSSSHRHGLGSSVAEARPACPPSRSESR